MFIRKEFLYVLLFICLFTVMMICFSQKVFAQSVSSDLSGAVSTFITSDKVSAFGQQFLDMAKSAFFTAVQIMINIFWNYIAPFFTKNPVLIVPVVFLFFMRFRSR